MHVTASTHSSAGTGGCRSWEPSSTAAAGGSSTHHATPPRSSEGVVAGWWAAPPPLRAAGRAASAAAPVVPPASWLSASSRASRLCSSSLLSGGLPSPLLRVLPLPVCCWLGLVAAEAAGRWREVSADTARQRCWRPLRSDRCTHCGDTMPTPAGTAGTCSSNNHARKGRAMQ